MALDTVKDALVKAVSRYVKLFNVVFPANSV